jgi:hypothetical protein
MGFFKFLWDLLSAYSGPPSLTGTDCAKCGGRAALREVASRVLRPNPNFHFDHYAVTYRCVGCGQEREQEELRPVRS